MTTHFVEKLVLAPWVLAQFGVADFERLSNLLKAPEFEGWAEDGGTQYVQQLVTRLPKHRALSDDQLREYDGHIVGHWKHITRHRNLHGQTLYPLYFQYLGLLVTEMYLDRYFRDSDSLVASLNVAVDNHNREAVQREQFALYTADDLNKLAFWMATGSGKTLLMHCHIRQYLHWLGKVGRRQELNRIILLTPNEGLSRQHQEEFELSGIEAEFYDRSSGTLFTGRGVDIIDIHKLREVSGEKTVAVDTFEGNNLVLVDEGHRGAGGEEWMDKRARLCAQGFSFEYSATFGQAIKAASSEKQKALTQTYAKCIKQYQVLVKKSEKQLIERLQKLAEQFKTGEFEAFSFDRLLIFEASRHLYQPLIHLSHHGGEDALIKVVPTHLNAGEKRFVDDLEAFCQAEAKGMLAEVELYLLRNHSSDKAIGFFTESGFRPDFILWLLKDGQQTIAFIDPKGMRHFTDNFNNPKVRFAKKIKQLQTDLKREDIRLESFLLSQTHRHDLRWPRPGESDQQATGEDYRQHHILFAMDNPPEYVRELIWLLI